MGKYYVYCYLDPRKKIKYNYNNFKFEYEPFYIGYGQNKRMFDHLNLNSKSNGNLPKKKLIMELLNENLKPIIIKISEKLTMNEAEILEINLIKNIGRIIDNTGPLTNITAGGKCWPNLANINRIKRLDKTWEEIYGKEISDKLKINLHNRMKGINYFNNKNSPLWNKNKFGYKIKGRSEESKLRTSESLKNSKKHKDVMSSKEVRDKISNTCRDLTTGYWKNQEYIDKVLTARKKYHESNPKIKKDELIYQLNLTLNKSKIKKHFNVSYPTLDKYIKKYGLQDMFKKQSFLNLDNYD